MKAVTHTEVYRPFQGTLEPRALRFSPIVGMGIRTAAKKRLPLLLLYAPPAIATIVFSFIVYGTYAAESLLESVDFSDVGGRMASTAAERALQQVQVKQLILAFHRLMTWFTLLATAWYGSGLFSDDRRAGAHQLYFSRPLTRLDYFAGKFFVVAFFAACALLLPGVLLCLMATFTSPDWSFVKDQWDVILETLTYGSLWVLVVSLAVLAASSLASKRVFSLIGMFGLFVLSSAFAALMGEEVNQHLFGLSPIWSIWRIGDWLFEPKQPSLSFPVSTAVLSLTAYVTLFLSVITWRLRRLEVVG